MQLSSKLNQDIIVLARWLVSTPCKFVQGTKIPPFCKTDSEVCRAQDLFVPASACFEVGKFKYYTRGLNLGAENTGNNWPNGGVV
jgi:hypothetical protein